MRFLTILCVTATANLAHATPSRDGLERTTDGVGAAASVAAVGALFGLIEETSDRGLFGMKFSGGFVLGSFLGSWFAPAIYDNATDGDGAVGSSALGAVVGILLGGQIIRRSNHWDRSLRSVEGSLLTAGAVIAGSTGFGYAVGDPLNVTPTTIIDGEQEALGLSFSGRF